MRKKESKIETPKNDDLINLDFKNEPYIIQIKINIRTKSIPCLHEMNYIDLCSNQKEAEKINRKLDNQINKIIRSHAFKKWSK